MASRTGGGNRFARRIRSGEIDSVEELKAEFKSLAKLSHPDLAGPGADHGDFAALRDEYEAALRDFERHRFGARRGTGGGRPRGEGAQPRDGLLGPLSESAWLCLELMLKRGFPKVPRHEKEGLRYEYARWRLEGALGPVRGEMLRAFESGLLDLRAFGSGSLEPTMKLVRDLVDYRFAGLPAMRTHIVLSLGRLKAAPGIGTDVSGFISLLAADLGIGGEIAL